MANQLNVSTGSILRTSEEFDDVVDTADRIVDDTTNELGRLTPIAGADHYGDLFNGNFNPALDAASGVVRGTSAGLKQTTQNLQTTAKFYSMSNELNTNLGAHL
jgi:excreted virulence factor EspC (type VII ESX diderm)